MKMTEEELKAKAQESLDYYKRNDASMYGSINLAEEVAVLNIIAGNVLETGVGYDEYYAEVDNFVQAVQEGVLVFMNEETWAKHEELGHTQSINQRRTLGLWRNMMLYTTVTDYGSGVYGIQYDGAKPSMLVRNLALGNRLAGPQVKAVWGPIAIWYDKAWNELSKGAKTSYSTEITVREGTEADYWSICNKILAFKQRRYKEPINMEDAIRRDVKGRYYAIVVALNPNSDYNKGLSGKAEAWYKLLGEDVSNITLAWRSAMKRLGDYDLIRFADDFGTLTWQEDILRSPNKRRVLENLERHIRATWNPEFRLIDYLADTGVYIPDDMKEDK